MAFSILSQRAMIGLLLQETPAFVSMIAVTLRDVKDVWT